MGACGTTLPQPGAEVASLLEAGAVTDRRHDGARDDRPDPRHRHQTLAAGVLLRQRLDVRRYTFYALVQPTPIRGQVGDESDDPRREHTSARAQDLRQRLAQGHQPLTDVIPRSIRKPRI